MFSEGNPSERKGSDMSYWSNLATILVARFDMENDRRNAAWFK